MKKTSHISKSSNNSLGNDKLLDYLSGNLTVAEQRQIELNADNDKLLNDALDGLSQSGIESQQLKNITQTINQNVWNQLNRKKKGKRRHKIAKVQQLWIVILLVLLVAIITYTVIHFSIKA